MLEIYVLDLTAVYLFLLILIRQIRLIVKFSDSLSGLRYAFTTYNAFQLLFVLMIFARDLESMGTEGRELIFALLGRVLLNGMGIIGVLIYNEYDFRIFTKGWWNEFLNGK